MIGFIFRELQLIGWKKIRVICLFRWYHFCFFNLYTASPDGCLRIYFITNLMTTITLNNFFRFVFRIEIRNDRILANRCPGDDGIDTHFCVFVAQPDTWICRTHWSVGSESWKWSWINYPKFSRLQNLSKYVRICLQSYLICIKRQKQFCIFLKITLRPYNYSKSFMKFKKGVILYVWFDDIVKTCEYLLLFP